MRESRKEIQVHPGFECVMGGILGERNPQCQPTNSIGSFVASGPHSPSQTETRDAVPRNSRWNKPPESNAAQR
jgi:hypothetical protein